MIIDHGSNVTVEEPKILTPNRHLDFGAGFYTITNYDQALNLAGKDQASDFAPMPFSIMNKPKNLLLKGNFFIKPIAII